MVIFCAIIFLRMLVVFYIFAFIFGAVFGSFLCCQAWRLRLMQEKKASVGKRSVCLHCKKQLKWYDNIPILSWRVLRGKCRYCGKKIGVAELLTEVLSGMAFLVLMYFFLEVCGGKALIEGGVVEGNILLWASSLVLFLLSLVLIFLSIYDGKWGELPTIFLIIACVLGIAYWVVAGFAGGFSTEYLWHSLGALALLSGLYEILYLVSRGRWVGDGDAILCIPIALVLGNVWLALFALFIANTLGCLYVLPTAVKKKGKRVQKIYFGPFLVVAFYIVLLFGGQILSLVKF